MKPRLAFTVIAGSLGGLLFGYDIGAMSSAAPGLREQFALSAAALGFAMSSALIGTILGSMAAGRLADAWGRRSTLSLAGLIYLVAILGAATASGSGAFAIARIVCGIAIGLTSVVAPMYLAEVSPAKLRGRIVGAFQFSLSVGVLAAFTLAYLFSLNMQPGQGWRYSLAIGAVPALLCEIFLLRASPSPRWLAIKGRSDKAISVFADLGSAHPSVDEAELAASLASFKAAGNVSLWSRGFTRPILLGISIAMFNQLTGVNALLYYILDVFTDLGSGRLNSRQDAILVSGVSLLVTTLSVGIIDKVGRKPLLLAGTVGMGICLSLFPAVRIQHWPAPLVVIILVAYNALFGFSQGVVVWVYLSEIFPLPIRARGQSLASTVHWVTNALVVGTFPAIVSSLHEKVFTGFALLMILQFFVVMLFYPETKHAGLESMGSHVTS